ncbi:two-component system response regulator, partial [Streptomyces albidoflavus]
MVEVPSARDLAVVREGVSRGVGEYVLKPFAVETRRERVVRYAQVRTAPGEPSGRAAGKRTVAAR